MDTDNKPQVVGNNINECRAPPTFYFKHKCVSSLRFSEICRICLSKNNISSMYHRVYENKSAFDILTLHAIIEVNPNDDMPQNICGNCKSTLFQLYSFVLKCKRSDSLLCSVPKSDLTDNKLDRTECVPEIATRKSNTSDEQEMNGLETKRVPPRISTVSVKGGNSLTRLKNAKCREMRNLKCTVCSKLFISSKLRQHMRAHTKEKPFKCKICFRGFSMSGNLKRHVMIHTGERPHVCEICGKGFIQATTLHNHKKTHTKYELISGDASCPNFWCTHCGRGFKRLARYEAHQKKHLGENNIAKSDKFPDGSAQHECSTCNKSYKTKHLLKAHQLTHGEKTFLCNECGKSFVTKAALQSHLKVHTGEKPHSCNVCRKSFAHIGSFEAHMLIHTGRRPYNCNICSRTFTQLSHLKYHMRTHSGERPYDCNYCGKSFALKGNLTVHVRTHTGETPYVCSVCCKGFYDSSSMKKHQRGHINQTLLLSSCEKNE